MTTDRNSEGAVATYGLRKRGEEAIIGVIPAKVHAVPAKCPDFLRDYEEVPLYTTPPASIPAAEVQALVERWRWLASLVVNPSERIHLNFADELAKLIPRNPE